MTILLPAIFFLSLTFLSSPALALTQDEASALGQRAARADAAAAAQLLRAANAGDAEAALAIGLLYYRGQPVEQDFKVALEWLMKAADGGSVAAMNLAGHFFQEGLGTAQDYMK